MGTEIKWRRDIFPKNILSTTVLFKAGGGATSLNLSLVFVMVMASVAVFE